MISLSDYRQKLSRSQGKFQLIEKQVLEAKNKKDELEKDQKSLEEAQVFLQDVAKRTQEQLKIHIEDTVQLAIDTCFPGKYEFKIQFEIKRGKTEAHLVFLKDGQEIEPMDDSGGGVVDISSFALRISAWTLSGTNNVIVLDEPFRFVSNDLQPLAAQVLSELSKTLKLQFIVVTHRPEIVDIADRVFEVKIKKQNGFEKSEVRRIS
jgi:DNA repair exonuclease SbcCD ATPase subunit